MYFGKSQTLVGNIRYSMQVLEYLLRYSLSTQVANYLNSTALKKERGLII